MKTIGLLGGMSWESTAAYYEIINTEIRTKLGGLNSAKVVLYSMNFAEIESLQKTGDWETAAKLIVDGAKRVEAGGAECLLICTNTMHKMADSVSAAISIPLLHIADATAAIIGAQGIKKIGLLGTRFTMEQEFYRGRLERKYGLEVVVPEERDRDSVHRIIYEELCQGVIKDDSRIQYLNIIQKLQTAGAEGIILGCTEIGLLISPNDCPLPVFDTSRIHAEAAVRFALS